MELKYVVVSSSLLRLVVCLLVLFDSQVTSSCLRREDRFSIPPGVQWKHRPNQLLSFQEPQSNVTVVLVGCMHYNPISADRLISTIYGIAGSGKLHSVVLEMCSDRWGAVRGLNLRKIGMHRRAWNKARSMGLAEGRFRAHVARPNVTWNPFILQSEMQVAEYLANAFEAELILGDARISETIKKLKHSYAETLRQILNPFKWKKLIEKILKSLFAVIGGGIGFRDVFDPAILLSGPIAILRYFIAAVKHRSIVLVLFGFSFFHLWMNGSSSSR
mmetsp:Transcript_28067/g.47602  ORF Transcript_28067/g.47602 Transcript_28067/m.47602 type:complete len:274 (-) Transcript_28067:43-864(-)